MPASKIAKAAIGFALSVCSLIRLEELGSHWTNFYEILCLKVFRKYVVKILVSLKSDKNNRYLT